MNEKENEIQENEPDTDEKKSEAFDEIKEIVIEELAVDGVCGIYWVGLKGSRFRVERLKVERFGATPFGLPTSLFELRRDTSTPHAGFSVQG